MKMKKMNLTLAVAFAIAAMTGASNAQAEKVSILSNGQQITIDLDMCQDPVTGRWGPCYFELQEKQADNDACWNEVTRRYEPCL